MRERDQKIAIIGAGNLGAALCRGLVESGWKPENIWATRRDVHKIAWLKDLGVNVTSNNSDAAEAADLIILAVKPFNYQSVLAEMSGSLDASRHMLVSVVTGVYISSFENILGSSFPIVRAMPNTAADIKESLTCLSHNPASSQHIASVSAIFNHLGESIEINEELMDAATVLGACGIAYVMRFIRAMVQGGVEIGFDANTALKIVQQTVKGAAVLLAERKNHPETEIDKVTTPKGCTIAGLNEMEHNGFSSALIKGLKASMSKISSPN